MVPARAHRCLLVSAAFVSLLSLCRPSPPPTPSPGVSQPAVPQSTPRRLIKANILTARAPSTLSGRRVMFGGAGGYLRRKDDLGANHGLSTGFRDAGGGGGDGSGGRRRDGSLYTAFGGLVGRRGSQGMEVSDSRPRGQGAVESEVADRSANQVGWVEMGWDGTGWDGDGDGDGMGPNLMDMGWDGMRGDGRWVGWDLVASDGARWDGTVWEEMGWEMKGMEFVGVGWMGGGGSGRPRP